MKAQSLQNNYLAGHTAIDGVDGVDGVDVLYVDESLLVLNKPSGLLSVPGRGEDKQDCLSRRVQAAYADALIVHRLDQATSGLMLMARGAEMQRALSQAFAKREVRKRYVAVVTGNMEELHRRVAAMEDGWRLIDLPIAVDWARRPLRIIDAAHGKPSQTLWKIDKFDEATNTTHVLLEPITGRSHQLRVHLQAMGHPILGDALYASEAIQAMASRLLLHACAIEFAHPVSKAGMCFTSDAHWQNDLSHIPMGV